MSGGICSSGTHPKNIQQSKWMRKTLSLFSTPPDLPANLKEFSTPAGAIWFTPATHSGMCFRWKKKIFSGVQQMQAGSPATLTLCTGLRSEEHTSELQSRGHLVCRLLLEKKKSS